MDVNVRIGASDRAVLNPAAKVVVEEDHEMQQMGLGGRAFLASIEAAAVRFVVTNAEIFVFGGGEHGYFFSVRFISAYLAIVLCWKCLISCNCCGS